MILLKKITCKSELDMTKNVLIDLITLLVALIMFILTYGPFFLKQWTCVLLPHPKTTAKHRNKTTVKHSNKTTAKHTNVHKKDREAVKKDPLLIKYKVARNLFFLL